MDLLTMQSLSLFLYQLIYSRKLKEENKHYCTNYDLPNLVERIRAPMVGDQGLTNIPIPLKGKNCQIYCICFLQIFYNQYIYGLWRQ